MNKTFYANWRAFEEVWIQRHRVTSLWSIEGISCFKNDHGMVTLEIQPNKTTKSISSANKYISFDLTHSHSGWPCRACSMSEKPTVLILGGKWSRCILLIVILPPLPTPHFRLSASLTASLLFLFPQAAASLDATWPLICWTMNWRRKYDWPIRPLRRWHGWTRSKRGSSRAIVWSSAAPT